MKVRDTILPKNSRRRALARRLRRRLLLSVRALERRLDSESSLEAQKLKRSWSHHAPDVLEDYLVTGYQNPRINAQSILTRHFLVGELFGSKFDELKREEMQFCVEANEAIRNRASELGVTISVSTDPVRRAQVRDVCGVIADREDTFERRWAEALRDENAGPLRVLELACGSANDYRFLDSYGIARFLDYTGIDLNDANVANARRRYPGVDFQVGDIMNLPFDDDSYDFVVAFDIFEHLSLTAMEKALGEAVRVARTGVVFAFFIMVGGPEHRERPRGSYHWNELSAQRIQEQLGKTFPSVTATHIPTHLVEEFGAHHSYNQKAWTIIARH